MHIYATCVAVCKLYLFKYKYLYVICGVTNLNIYTFCLRIFTKQIYITKVNFRN